MPNMQNPPLVFLHGFPFNGDAWAPQMAHFKNTRTVYAPDLRGHRNGPTDQAPWMIAHFAEDLLNTLDQKKIDKAVVIGLSMGGYVALHFAIQYPQRLAGLVLANTRADADSNEAKDKRFALIQRVHKEGLEKFAPEFAKSVLSEYSLKEKPRLQDEIAQLILSNQPENVAMIAGALASRRDSFPFLNKIKVPTLVLTGSADKTIPPENGEKMAQAIEGAEFKKIENAGHFVNLENPSDFNRNLDEFLAKL